MADLPASRAGAKPSELSPVLAAALAACVTASDIPRATAALLRFGSDAQHREVERVRGYILATAVFRRPPPVDVTVIERVADTACGDRRDVLQGMAHREVIDWLSSRGLPR